MNEVGLALAAQVLLVNGIEEQVGAKLEWGRLGAEGIDLPGVPRIVGEQDHHLADAIAQPLDAGVAGPAGGSIALIRQDGVSRRERAEIAAEQAPAQVRTESANALAR